MTETAHLIVDRVEDLVMTATATFSPCTRGHTTVESCRAEDASTDATEVPCRPYRYALTRTWDHTRPPAVFIMLNPSVADAFQLDPTVTRCRRRALDWGAGGLVVLNLFGLRSTDPSGLLVAPNHDPVGPDNDLVLTEHLADHLGRVVVAWGAHTIAKRRADAVLDLLHRLNIQVDALGVTKYGDPRHPLYVRMSAHPTPYVRRNP